MGNSRASKVTQSRTTERLAMTRLSPSKPVPPETGHRSSRLIRWAFFVFLSAFTLTACGEKKKEAEGSASSISGYNYTIEGIQEFYVNGAWGGNLGIGDGGGTNVCCIMLPRKWTPGLSATVEWRRTDCRGDRKKRCPRGVGGEGWPHESLKKTVPIEPYDRPYELYVAFLPNDEVKLYVTPISPEDPAHPLKLGRAHPLDHPEWKPYQP
jgi:hypothetical protein